MAVNILHQVSILESMNSRDDQQDGGQDWEIHLLGQTDD